MARFVVELEQQSIVRREVFVEAASVEEALGLVGQDPLRWPLKREDDVAMGAWTVVDSWKEGEGYGEG